MQWQVVLATKETGKLQLVDVFVHADDRQHAEQRALDEAHFSVEYVVRCVPVLSAVRARRKSDSCS